MIISQSKTTQQGFKIEQYSFNGANDSLIDRYEATSLVSSSVYGKYTVKDAEKRYNSLLVQCNKETPSRPLQFIPIVIPTKQIPLGDFCMLINNFLRYSYITKDFIYTNLRAVLKLEQISNGKYKLNRFSSSILSKQYKKFKVFRLTIPVFIRDQIKTHTRLSSISQSSRVSKYNISGQDYYLPIDIIERIKPQINNLQLSSNPNIQQIKLKFKTLSYIEVQQLLRKLKYPKQLYTRFPNGLRMMSMVLGGWINDPHTWQNFILERADNNIHKHWTQSQTRKVANEIKMMLDINV